ncbi:claudin-4-like [Anguilla anguilla]|uniref:claudin-4-like n=1 Tax=Anguilla anguilla TaxID=7936 RepID=UPI0015B03BE0|nr:claudin-4-like [Anguilla anguilla]XP_035240253.1 claudin-4-like [Anguilla anguilla]XP_035240254.1 claudin-4-like [Anguilla anguilla]XP_035240255.1 claudin-4-like [Anguilla anguilla]XP_035240256.1 claudin-4-like [Anguilla anguilla]XP_035240258.1 claudin-4-like [Anguilla anguilla]XP_035240259.1 claudin-4-like [Anguilla anguilla]
MGRICKEVTGQVFCFIGFLGVIIVCGIPMWRVTTRIGANVVSGQVVWDGLWMNCVMQSTGQMQCSIHESLLKLSRDLQASRALIVTAIVVAFVGLTFTVIGAKCTSCLDKDASKAKTVILGGAICIASGATCVIPVSWSAATTIADFQSSFVSEERKRDLGAAIYIGWATSALLIIGGSILCTSCPPVDNRYGWGYPGQRYPPQYYPGPAMTAGTYMPAKVYIPNRSHSASSQYIPNNAYPSGASYSPVNYL